MKKRDILSLLYQLASPALLMVLGLILLVSPDTASALISRIIGWGLTLVGIGVGISAIVDRRGAVGKGIAAVLCVITGGWLTSEPLLLAAGIGRILGLIVAARGIRDILLARSYGNGKTLAVLTTLVGVVLVVLPMTTSRLVFRICGIAVLVIGAAMAAQRVKDHRYLEGGSNDIIDAL